MKNKNFRKSTECSFCYNGTSELFSYLTKTELNLINQNKSCGIFTKGSIIYNEGTRLNHMYCINNGVLKLYSTGSYGKEQIIRFVKKGELIGFRSALTGDISAHSAKVIEGASICVIPADLFIQFIGSNSRFALHIIQMLCRELNRYSENITDLAQKSVRQRLAAILIDLKDTFGLDENQHIKIALTREDLANLAGTATETIIRQLSEFRNDKIIAINSRKIQILNLKTLIKISNL